jgi:hypothetical protein
MSKFRLSPLHKTKDAPKGNAEYHQDATGTLDAHHWDTKCTHKFRLIGVNQLWSVLNSSKGGRRHAKESGPRVDLVR